MSTNYYLRQVPSKKDKRNIKKLIDNNEIDFAISELNKASNKFIIGHRAGGWEFVLYLHNEKYYEPSKASVIQFANDNNYIVVDEYNNKYTIEEFFDNIVNDWNSDLENNLDYERYFAQSSERYYQAWSPYSFQYWEEKGYAVNKYGELHNDGLRWNIAGEQFSD